MLIYPDVLFSLRQKRKNITFFPVFFYGIILLINVTFRRLYIVTYVLFPLIFNYSFQEE